ncbi:chemotaxis protein CheD [Hyphococcus sp.]|uniref:chemotaxis protein CheD n=1 Tax=Hyphococcus sp. TaxID=2038636 RepID=UPI003D110617
MHSNAASSTVAQSAVKTIHVIQGDFSVSRDPNAVMTTILGSCVATCLFDPVARVGGMNHFLLPGDASRSGEMTFGVHAMELLINALLKKGADKYRLQAKLFGGARMIEGLSDIGAKNATFAREFLARENIPCVGESLGGTQARRIRFEPTTGRARQRVMGDAAAVPVAKPKPAPAPVEEPGSDVELF